MKIGIDISQLVYPQTGVSNYLKNWLTALFESDKKNEYILFFSSLRGEVPALSFLEMNQTRVHVKKFKIPPSILHLLWNTLHIFPIEMFIGKVDIFISSDWTQPPSKAKKATILYDLLVYKFAHEMHRKIVVTQRKRLYWVKKDVDIVFCISRATKKDAEEILHIPEKKLFVLYPGI